MADKNEEEEKQLPKPEGVISIALPGDELTDKLGGGLPKNALMLVESPNATGKSALVQRFTWGALQNDTSVSYISTELSFMSFIRQMESFSYTVKKDILDQKLLFLSMFPSIGKVKLRPDFMDRLLDTQEIFQKDVIILDTLSYLLVKDDAGYERCFDIMNRLKRIASRNKVVIICVEKGHLNEKLMELLRSMSDCYLTMETKDQFGKLVKMLHVARYSGAASDVEEDIAFNVKAGIGIVVEVAGLA